ncbi:MAG: DUF3995 domain-containing protein [Lapillicoccus sp.]
MSTGRKDGMPQPSRPGRAWFGAAAAVGLLHAAFSAYWALGGRWLLDTVGSWATGLAESAPVGAGLALGVVTLAKVAGAVVPLLVERGRLGHRRLWRRLEWAGGGLLLVYGLGNAVVAWAVLLGVIVTADGYDARAQLGHAALWDPLFALWGALLLAGLRRSRGT